MNFLGKEESPLSADEWKQIEEAVVQAARNTLVCRKFVPIFGPIGPGHQMVPYDVIYGMEPGVCEIRPGQEYETCEPVRTGVRKHIPIPTIYKDFVISWRDLEYWRQFNMPVDTSNAVAAAVATAVAEDTLILLGNKNLGLEGLMTAEGINKMSMSDWSVVGNAFNDVMAGISKLVEQGFYGNYYLVVNPKQYFQLNRMHDNSGLLEIEQIKKIVEDVLQTPIVPENRALLVSAGPQNFDLVVAQDISVAYVESSNMNHIFRVLEMVALRIKRPGSILVIGKGK
jgi:uncharacterized linocin/CFP29 family protein